MVGGTDDCEMVEVVTADSLDGAGVDVGAGVSVVGGGVVVGASEVVGGAEVVVEMSTGDDVDSTAEVVSEVSGVLVVAGAEVLSVLGTADVSDMAARYGSDDDHSDSDSDGSDGGSDDRDAGTCDAVRRGRAMRSGKQRAQKKKGSAEGNA